MINPIFHSFGVPCIDYGIFYKNAAHSELSKPFCEVHRRCVVGVPANHNVDPLCRTYGAWHILDDIFYENASPPELIPMAIRWV